MSLSGMAIRIDRGGRIAAIALGAAIPCSVALDNTLLLLVLLCWLAGGSYREKWLVLRNNPVAWFALLLAGFIFAGLAWTDPSATAPWKTALKYIDLAFVPLFLYYFRDAKSRHLGLMAFAGMTLLVLMLSFMVKTGHLEYGDLISGAPISPVVFKFRITHNFLMAFGALVFAWFAYTDRGIYTRLIWAALATVAAGNVLFMVEGATGQLVLAAMGLSLALTLLSRRIRLLALLAAPLIATALLIIPGPIAKRANVFKQELTQWQPGVGQRDSSAGLRMEFFGNTAAVIADNPLSGVGTGGFPVAYADKVKGTSMLATNNPHNEYLMITAQVGLVGLCVLLGLFITQWRVAKKLPSQMETGIARGLVIAMAIGCLFNSFLLDHAEGLFFAWMSGLLFAGYRSDTPTGQSA